MNFKEFTFDNILFVNFTSIEKTEKHLQILSLRNDERIRKFMFSDKIISLEEHLEFIERLRNDDKRLYWAAYDGELLVGSINLIDIDYQNIRAKLGIYTNPDLKGYGSKLINALKWLCFEQLNFNCLRLEVLANNMEAIKFYEKHYFSYEGRLRSFIFREGNYIDVLVYSILKEEYEKSKS